MARCAWIEEEGIPLFLQPPDKRDLGPKPGRSGQVAAAGALAGIQRCSKLQQAQYTSVVS